MPGAYIFGWDATNEVWVKCLVNAEGKLIIDPSEIFENTPTDNEHGKAPDSDWAHDHAAVSDAHHAQLHAASHEDGGTDPISNLGGNVVFPGRSYFRVLLTSSFDISAGTWSVVRFDDVMMDNRGEFDAVNYKFVAGAAGFYWFCTAAYFGVGATGDRIETAIEKNGYVDIFKGVLEPANVHSIPIAAFGGVYLNSGDYIKVRCINRDSNDVIGSYNEVTYFCGCLIA